MRVIIKIWLFISFTSCAQQASIVTNQELNFGTLLIGNGSCKMIATTGVMLPHVGQFLCELPDGSQNGKYTITAQPYSKVKVKVLPNLQATSGVIFNPLVYVKSDTQARNIYNKTDFVEIDAGDSGIVEIFIGGELFINRTFATGTEVQFSLTDVFFYEVIE